MRNLSPVTQVTRLFVCLLGGSPAKRAPETPAGPLGASGSEKAVDMTLIRQGGRAIATALMTMTLLATLVPAAAGGGALVTQGEFSTFAAGGDAGYDIGGHATMVRNANQTKVTVHVTGLTPGETYVSHVHNQACADGDAGGHFKQDPLGASEPPNEIWPGDGAFSPNQAGIANQKAAVAYFANSDAVSVVIHWKTGGVAPKVACADLS